MKIQLDTEKKTIKLDSNVKLEKLIDTLEKLLPKGEWKKFTLETNTQISYWTNPIIYREYPSYPYYPWYCSTTTGNTAVGITGGIATYNSDDVLLQKGTYNIEV